MTPNQEKFIELLKQVERPGIDNLCSYMMKDTDFFVAPASATYHGACEGGLLDHSLAVYDNLLVLANAFFESYDHQSLIVCALLHDICKTNFYRRGYRNRKNEQTGQWEKIEVYEIDDKLPLGHGEKSVMILQRFIQLTVDETMAIRWHMGGFDDAARGYAGAQCLSNAMKNHPLLVALHMADMATCYFTGK
ncbi:hypothetical protein SDC9_107066 [bioreactor metagenome]|uniref:HD domain-containing protein n=1 Tax=bioreactor metagenome TaxID=1076179 RepID=A0A645B465_9ZZZZ